MFVCLVFSPSHIQIETADLSVIANTNQSSVFPAAVADELLACTAHGHGFIISHFLKNQ